MRIDDVIIVASWLDAESAQAASRSIESGIRELLRTGRRAIVAIGAGGDELLFGCPSLERCELAFVDAAAAASETTSQAALNEAIWMDAVWAGLESAAGGAIVVEWDALARALPWLETMDRCVFANHRAEAIAAFDGPPAESTPLSWILSIAGARKIKAAARATARSSRRASRPDRSESWENALAEASSNPLASALAVNLREHRADVDVAAAS